MHLPTFTQFRTTLLLALGVFVILWETVVQNTDRPYVLIVGLMLCGFPYVLNLDKLLRGFIPAPISGIQPVPPPDVPPPPVKEAAS